MDCCKHLPLTVKPSLFLARASSSHSRSSKARTHFENSGSRRGRLGSVIVGASRCEPSLNTPLEPRSATGKYLTGVLQNQRQFFHVAVAEELKLLASDRDEAARSVAVTEGADEACLYRRIAEIKQRNWQISIRELMYAVILFKFSEIKVHLVPKLSNCIYNGRLEIWPAKDWELESIHGIDSLEMIKEHITAAIGLRADASVTDNWAITQVQRPHLGQVYAASILYGYFLKSAFLRHNLERNLALPHLGHCSRNHSYRWSNLLFGHINKPLTGALLSMEERRLEKFRCYVMGFDQETLQRCTKVRSKEAVDLIEQHSCALFGDGKIGLVDSGDIIVTSFSSLKRLVLEAVAFGTFLWDVEEHVDAIYKLHDN